MGNLNAKELDMSDFNNLETEFGVTQDKIKILYERFTALDRRQCGSLSPEDFTCIPGLASNPVSNRLVALIFSVYDENNILDWNHIEEINFRHFVSAYSIFATPTSSYTTEAEKQKNMLRREVQLRFFTKLHDIQGKGYIDRADLKEIVKVYMLHGSDDSFYKNSDGGGNCSVDATIDKSIEEEYSRNLKLFFGTKEQLNYEEFEVVVRKCNFHKVLDSEILRNPLL